MALVGKKMVEQMIKSKALVVISKSYCPFCHKVRGVVKKNNGLFTVRLTVRVDPPLPPLTVRVS